MESSSCELLTPALGYKIIRSTRRYRNLYKFVFLPIKPHDKHKNVYSPVRLRLKLKQIIQYHTWKLRVKFSDNYYEYGFVFFLYTVSLKKCYAYFETVSSYGNFVRSSNIFCVQIRNL